MTVAGLTGLTGLAGLAGLTGLTGLTGLNGLNGLNGQRLIEPTGMTWTYMWDWTAISDGPTTIAPL